MNQYDSKNERMTEKDLTSYCFKYIYLVSEFLKENRFKVKIKNVSAGEFSSKKWYFSVPTISSLPDFIDNKVWISVNRSMT